MDNADRATNVLAWIEIPGEVRAKKNSRTNRKGSVPTGTSVAHQKWHAAATASLMTKGRLLRLDKQDGPVSVYIDLWRGTLHEYDPDNMGTSVLDLLEDYGVLATDGFPLVHCVRSRHAGIDRERPRAVVTIYDGADGPQLPVDLIEVTEIGDRGRTFVEAAKA